MRGLPGAAPQLHAAAALPQGQQHYTLEPVHEGYEVLSSKSLGTLRNNLAVSIPRSRGGLEKSKPVFLAGNSEARTQARVDAERAWARIVVVHQALHLQAWLHRWPLDS